MDAAARFELEGFVVRVRGGEKPAGLQRALAERIALAAREERVLAERFEFEGRALWLKGDHLPGKARWRHSLWSAAGRATPREREFERLKWLRARLFRAPEPIACGAARAGVLVRYQFLCLAALGPHEPLSSAWARAGALERAAWSDELARELARLHALHVVHRNLFLRNVLVDRTPTPASGDPRRLILIDPWRAGAPLPRRGVDYDLGALLLDAVGLWSADELARWFARYFEQRRTQSSPANAARLLARAAQRRIELARRARVTAPEWNVAAALARLERGVE